MALWLPLEAVFILSSYRYRGPLGPTINVMANCSAEEGFLDDRCETDLA